jgi:hypothetical protein
MIETIERMLGELERGKLTRRQFAVSLATLAAGAFASPPRSHRRRNQPASALSA